MVNTDILERDDAHTATASNEDSDGNYATTKVFNEALQDEKSKPPDIEVDVQISSPEMNSKSEWHQPALWRIRSEIENLSEPEDDSCYK